MDGNVVQEFIEAIKEPQVDTNKTYIAAVSRIDNEGVVWVHVQGSEKETPTELSAAEVKSGDTVNVEWRNNKLYIATNVSNPSVGVMTVAPAVDYINLLEGKDISVNSIEAATGYIDELYSKNITADSLVADHAMIKELDVESMSAATAYIRDLTSENITADDIIADHATIDTLDSDYAHITNGVIDNAKIGYADVDNLSANYAQINGANINTATIRDNWVNQLMVQTGLIASEGAVYYLDAIQVNASNITAGTIDVERLIVTVDGEKYLVHIDPSTSQASYEKLDGDVIEDLTITADKIVAGAITAEKITTNNIVGSGGWINLRSGTFNYTNATSGNYITWDGTNLNISATNISLGSQSLSSTLTAMQNEIDGAIETWYYTVDPTLSNAPASSWITDDAKNTHLRDLYFNTTNGHSFRWAIIQTADSSIVSGKTYYTYNSTTGLYTAVSNPTASGLPQYYEFKWIQIEDADAIKALADAAAAQGTADAAEVLAGAKRRVFVTTPTPPYDIGDLWAGGSTGDLKKCKTAKTTGQSYSASDWELATKYTDDSNVYTKSDFSITPEQIIGKVTKTETLIAGQYATCATGASTATKVAIISPNVDGWELYTGATITVKFTYANTAASPSLNVKGKSTDTGSAKAIKTYTGGTLAEADYKWSAGDTLMFVYNGTNWLMQEASTRLKTAESSITQNANNIELKVSKDGVIASINASTETSGGSAVRINADKVNITGTAVFNAVDADADAKAAMLNSELEIGGRNISLATGTAQALTLSSGNYWFTPAIYTTTEYGKALLADTSNTRFTVSYDYSITGVTGNATLRALLRYTSEDSYSIGTIISGEHPTISSGSSSGHASITFDPNSGSRTYGTKWMIMVNNTTAEKAAVANATLTISNFKFEIGTKATDWTPAPEDTDSAIAAAQSTAEGANAQEQIIYKQAVSGTNTMSGTTTWVTATSESVTTGTPPDSATGLTPVWTTKRPSYQKNYPVLFVATQRKTVGGTVTCTTPLKDDTTTIIDGGNITTGTIDANCISSSVVNAINANVSDTINGNKINASEINIGSLAGEIGGRNLILKSDTVYEKDLSTSGTVLRAGDLSDYGKTVLGVVDTDVVLSFEAKASTAGLKVGGRYIRDSSGNPVTTIPAVNTITLTTGWVRYVAMFAISATGAAYLGFYTGGNTATSGTVSVRNVKVETGNKATDWTPAPEDAVNDNLLIGSQKMSAWRLGGSASRDTTDDFGVITLTGSSSNWNATTDYMPTLRISILDGTPLWLSFEYKASTAITSMNLILAGTALSEGSYFTSSQRTKYSNNMLSSLPAASSWTRKAVAMPTSLSELVSGSGNVNSIYVQFYNRTDNSTVQIRKVKLEHGFSATDWTSSSEDQKAYITRIDDAGIRIHPSNTENNSVVINASGMEIFKGGTGTSNSVAFYGDTTRVGVKANNKTRLELSNTNMDIVFRNSSGTDATLASFGTEAVIRTADGTELAHFGYESGAGPDDGTATAPYYNLGYRSTTSSRGNLTSKGNFSLVSGASNIASGFCSHAEGYGSESSGYASHAEGTSYAEAEKAHAEGHGCIAANPYSHAEGYYCHAAGDSSHAEGFMCVTGSAHSHASGIGTHSYRQGQTVVGMYNVLNAQALFLVGNGSSDSNRSDAFWVNPDGSAVSAAGMLTQSGQAKVPDVFNTPPASESYGVIMRLWGDGKPNTSHSLDTYWLGVGSSGKLYTGIQINGATAITWREK